MEDARKVGNREACFDLMHPHIDKCLQTVKVYTYTLSLPSFMLIIIRYLGGVTLRTFTKFSNLLFTLEFTLSY